MTVARLRCLDLVGVLHVQGEVGLALLIKLPGSFATYSANAAIAALTVPASGAFTR